MSKKGIEFFKQYNEVFSEAYDSFLFDNQNKYEKEEYIKKYINEWVNKKNELFENTSPMQYLENLSYEQLKDIFCIGAKTCDDYLPDTFLNLFLDYEKSNEYFLSLLTKEIKDDDDRYIIVASIKALAQKKNEETIQSLIILINRVDDIEELIREEIRDAIVLIGDISIPYIIKNINSARKIEEGHEYLLMALSEIVNDKDNLDVFNCLRNSFMRMDNKVLGAHCLAKVGWVEAIPLLRNYVVENKDNLNKITFYEIVKAIQILGGEIESLQM